MTLSRLITCLGVFASLLTPVAALQLKPTDYLIKVSAITTGAPIAPNFNDGVKCIEVLEAGLKSAASGQRVTIS